jgi:hypothetical protein
MNNINEIDINLYGSYAITSFTENIKIYTVHPEGEFEFFDYELFSLGANTLIAFTSFDFSKSDNLYKVVSNKNIETIDFQIYEAIIDVIDENYEKEKNLFVLMNSVPVQQKIQEGSFRSVVDLNKRCDINTFGAMAFIDTSDGISPTIVDYSIMTADNITGSAVTINYPGSAVIMKIIGKNFPESSYKNWPSVVGTCRTLTGAIRLAIEWSKATQSPWNSQEEIAIKSKDLLEKLQIPNDVIKEIIDFQTPMPVEMFLSGDPNPRRSIDEKIKLPPLFKKWYMSRIRYKSLNTLAKNFPDNIEIPVNILNKEKNKYEQIIFEFCILNNIDYTNNSAKEILNLLNTNSNFRFTSDKNIYDSLLIYSKI